MFPSNTSPIANIASLEFLNGLEKSLKNQDKQISEIEKLQKSGKEKDNLEFKDQQKVNEFIKRQKQQDAMMKEFAEKMKDVAVIEKPAKLEGRSLSMVLTEKR